LKKGYLGVAGMEKKIFEKYFGNEEEFS